MRYGFRVFGKKGLRKFVIAKPAFAGYAQCVPDAEVDREAFLSAFTFGDEFWEQLKRTGSTRDYFGPCAADFVWWDVDRADLDEALADARVLAAKIDERYGEPLAFFTGKKGFHLGLATPLWNPAPSLDFNRVAKRFAIAAAERAGVEIDTSVYDKVRPFRAPNSRHAATGLYKVKLDWDELMSCSMAEIKALATLPRPFDVPTVAGFSQQAADDWKAAEEWIVEQTKANSVRSDAHLNRLTLDFIRDGAPKGERARRVFSAAANLAEFGCPRDLAFALLEEAALDSGLPPSEVQREIECGLAHRSARQSLSGALAIDESVPSIAV